MKNRFMAYSRVLLEHVLTSCVFKIFFPHLAVLEFSKTDFENKINNGVQLQMQCVLF